MCLKTATEKASFKKNGSPNPASVNSLLVELGGTIPCYTVYMFDNPFKL